MRALARRAMLAGTAALAAGGARGGVPASGRLSFQAFRNGSRIGSHGLEFQRRGSLLTVAIAVEYVVRFGPIPVFRYTLRAQESWEGDSLAEIRAQTSDNGEKCHMSAIAQGGRLAVDGSKSGRYVAPAGAIAATHWNRREVEGPMISPQDGELLSFAVAPGGLEAVPLAGGGSVQARHVVLSGTTTLELWYEPDGTWAALRAGARDGSVITYRRE